MERATLLKKRRERFMEHMESGVAVIPTAPARVRSNDVEFKFRPDSDFVYLTGFTEPEATAVFFKNHGEHRFVLFVRPRDKEKETWTGRRAGVEGAVRDHGADAAFPTAELADKLRQYLNNASRLYYHFGRNPETDGMILSTMQWLGTQGRAGLHPPPIIVDHTQISHEMRLIKEKEDLAALRRSTRIASDAHVEAMRMVRPGIYEYEVEATIEHHFRRHGAEYPAYPSIIGSGGNATILHYVENSRRMEDGDMLLVDAGCEYDYWAADITRTYPVNGRFTPAQRAMYDLVLTAQKEAIAASRPGVTFLSVHERARGILVDGMIDLGLLAGPAKDAIESGAFKKFYPHRTGHWLGMDVHDVGRYMHGDASRKLEPGMVMTVEPGLYVPPDEPGVPEAYRGIGIRIEDDVLITARGREVLTAECPKEPADLERELRAARRPS